MVSSALLKKILSKINASKDAAFKHFAEVYLANVDDNDVSLYSPDDMAVILKTLWDSMQKRAPGETNMIISSPLNPVAEWESQKTSFFITTKERAFLIDSIAAELISRGHRIVSLMHPMLSITRDKKNKITAVHPAGEKDIPQESVLFIEIEGSLSANQCKELHNSLLGVLSDVRHATNDWLVMKGELLKCIEDLKANAPLSSDDLQKYLDFLQYLHDDNFTLLGYREYAFKGKDKKLTSKTVKKSSLGLLSDDVKPAYINEKGKALSSDFQQIRQNMPVVTISKVNRRSTVHRRVPLDGIHIKIFNKKGEAVGERLFIGLFTSVTYSRSVSDIPLLREKVSDIIDRFKFNPNSHNYKALNHILEKYPRDELFQIDGDLLEDFALGILRLQERPCVALYTRVDPFKRYISCLVYIPRDLYETNLRVRFQRVLEEELGGTCNTFYTTLDDSPLARVLFLVKTDQAQAHDYDIDAVEQKLIDSGKPWDEHLLGALIEKHGEKRESFELCRSYGHAFPIAYQEKFTASQAVKDIAKIEEVHKDGEIRQVLYRPVGLHNDHIRLKVYNPESPIPLSDIIPIIENIGLKARSELPFEIKANGHGKVVYIHDFLLDLLSGSAVKIKDVKDIFEDALHQIWYKKAENDSLNKLVLSAGIPWRDVVILRAYTKYLKQANFPYTPQYVMKALTDFPEAARVLVDWFKALHDPQQSQNKNPKKKPVSGKKYQTKLNKALEAVSSLDQDRILRAFGTLIDNTLRTNFFQTDEAGEAKSYVSFKINSPEISFLPLPRPMVEVFVYSPRMEGVHLRGGKIARGGIRWSDRHEDFRTEILGLMKAQMVKNAVIVPIGAKGGFIVKNPPQTGDRQDFFNEGVECYKILVRGLLDITDNLDQAKVLHPDNVVRRDDDDPYLVVAADKGTATFSDIANGLSEEYGFWLGDAFASGGSAGYDHKGMGITAKGAWESVKRHFRELNHDTQTAEFDVIGVGDMGGDVFGNGMLLSEKIRLVGAFNHLHIFCDPAPNAAKTFKERQRLFDNVKGWDAYNSKLLSPGGMIYNRSDKSLKLTPQIKERFQIEEDEVTPNALIKAMLKAQTDLLWFGGIGTYIKASDETDADVGDKTNDPLRVDAYDIRASVLGEGANLGVTQKARIEMAMRGTKLNADFIDNSGGVDCSDHEVNIKIMLARFMAQNPKAMTIKKRNVLLEKMTDEVGDLVLENNYQQSQAISLTELTAAEDLRTHAQMISELEHYHGLDRKLEALPNEEMIAQRIKSHKGLTRPEIGTLISYAKIRLYNDLMGSDVPDDSAYDAWLVDYFPKPLQKKYSDTIIDHKLKREIVATRMTGSIVNRFGPTFVMQLVKKANVDPHEAAKACFFVRQTFGFKKMWNGLEALDNKVPAKVQLDAMRHIASLTEHATLWFLNNDLLVDQKTLAPISELYQDGLKEFKATLNKTLPKSMKKDQKQLIAMHKDNGMPDSLAKDIACLDLLRSSCDITHLASKHKQSIECVSYIYHHVGELLSFSWLHHQASHIFAGNKWQENVLESLQGSLYNVQAEICASVLVQASKVDKEQKIEHWQDKHKKSFKTVQKMIAEMRRTATLDLSMLTLAEQRLRRLISFE